MGTDMREIFQYIFTGVVDKYGEQPGTVVVTRPDQDDRTSAELHVISRGTKATKDYWMPAIGDEVLCILLPNASGNGPGEGFVIGAHYSDVDAPEETDTNTRSVRYKDGSYIVNKSGAMEIHASKSLVITAPVIKLN